MTSIEFAMVAAPFFFLVLSIMTIGTQFLTMHSLENGVSEASRKIRTGEAQTAGLNRGAFRQLVCSSAGSMISCDTHLVVHVKSATSFAGLVPPPTCTTNGNLTPAAGSATDALSASTGQENMKVIVVACYNWEAGVGLWQVLWNLVSPTPPVQGKTVLSAAAVFQTEPYK
ncbi:TadE/TadG family type IV pilus assembly protein [Hyphomicrobium sp.]|uniref:TadE/TadG family type IV pilus assembly protein n=1 Tax=Hyphomicrobium sp. TaxID=82 RepID=UPI003F6FE5BD